MRYGAHIDAARNVADAVNKPRPSRVLTAEPPKNKRFMEKYICTVCGYVYDPELGDPENGIEAGTPLDRKSVV